MERIALSRPSISDDEVAAAERALRSGWLVYGAENRAFEEELAAYCGRRYATTVSSGTAALHLALLGLGALPKAVLVPAFTFPATANVTRFLPQAPALYLSDVEPDTFCMSTAVMQHWQKAPPVLLEKPAGTCIVVHQFGYPAPLPAGEESHFVSDAACAVGVAGAMRGAAVCLSFHPRKLLTTGEGGAVLSDDQGFIEEVRRLRAHGLMPNAGSEVMALPRSGLNYRLSEVSAAVGRAQLRRLPGFVSRHRELAVRYHQRFGAANVRLVLQADHPDRIYQTLALLLPEGIDRPQIRQKLLDAGIETQIAGYGLHRLAAFADASVFPASQETDWAKKLPNSDRLHRQGLALPLHSEMRDRDVDRVCDVLLSLLDGS